MIHIANPTLGREEKDRVTEVIDSGMVAEGDVVHEFESDFASYCGADTGLATTNGTTALHAALVGLGIGDGDRVLTTPFSFIATANTPRLAGADVDFVDIDPETYNIDPEALESRLRAGEDVDAVIAVHLYGLPADVGRLRELADEYDFKLLEDAAQAHGAKYEGTRVGTFGDAACFSFYPTKNMTTGEGGMVLTDDEEVAERTRRFVDHGRTEGYEHASVGHNFRMTNIAAAIGLAQMERLPGFTEARRRNAARLTEELTDVPGVTPPAEPEGYEHVYHQYTVRVDDRDGLQEHLSDAGVGTGVYYPVPIHRQPAYDDVGGSYPEAEAAAEEVLSLPVHPALEDDDIDDIVAAMTRSVVP
ncbi:DegT/DnrJ/EryC1/StrS family aminotransferase [Halogeometricum luteum]|uniref:DegT/DnrJ/EryC1/StrS family aminotransferase n=1 Tax=Halogeometricum luteum TaxID=2950537 RepID=A0ABU2G306_9EURY|nr:DegT/DnrJ/EryC1/StrS family aminotransferase [Halogeometricum sp. S3BR5-2]MDS0295160.1 DegT/DnrJ/EryC1/StrS family aminotransferase [Halogeometricum sp. S3BR5-2]